jgi:hypothetical protein
VNRVKHQLAESENAFRPWRWLTADKDDLNGWMSELFVGWVAEREVWFEVEGLFNNVSP